MNVQDMVSLSFIPVCLKIMKVLIVVRNHTNINNVEKTAGVTGSFSSMSEIS